MGGHAYWYWVPYRDDLQSVLDELRTREFDAGRYNPVLPFITFSEPAFSEQTPGKQHKTIKAALRASAEDGTRSILDINLVGTHSDYGVAGPLAEEIRVSLFGAANPTREQIEGGRDELYDYVERGKAVYVVAHAGGAPAEIFIVGYSYD